MSECNYIIFTLNTGPMTSLLFLLNYLLIEYVKGKKLSLVSFFLIFIVICGIFMQVKEIFTVESFNNWDCNHYMENFHHSTHSNISLYTDIYYENMFST